MWNRLKSVEGYLYMISVDDHGYQFYLTDLGQLWGESLSTDMVMARSKEVNPRATVPLKKLLELVETFPVVAVHEELVRQDAGCVLKMKQLISGMPFSWAFRLKLESPDEFRKLVVFPLIHAAGIAPLEVVELISVIHKKDKEIDDYKASGARVSRRHLETQPFNKELFLSRQDEKSAEKSLQEDPLDQFCKLTGRIYSRLSKDESNSKESVEDGATEIPSQVSDAETQNTVVSNLEVTLAATVDEKPKTSTAEIRSREKAHPKPKTTPKKKKLRI